MKSLTQPDSLGLFGGNAAKNGEQVMAALQLTPKASGSMEAEFTLLISAYSRKAGNIHRLLEDSEILYLDKHKNRANKWLKSLGVQFPSHQPKYGSIGSIVYAGANVNSRGTLYSAWHAAS